MALGEIKNVSLPGHNQGKLSIEHNREERVKLVQAPPRGRNINPNAANQFLNLKLARGAELLLHWGPQPSFLRA